MSLENFFRCLKEAGFLTYFICGYQISEYTNNLLFNEYDYSNGADNSAIIVDAYYINNKHEKFAKFISDVDIDDGIFNQTALTSRVFLVEKNFIDGVESIDNLDLELDLEFDNVYNNSSLIKIKRSYYLLVELTINITFPRVVGYVRYI